MITDLLVNSCPVYIRKICGLMTLCCLSYFQEMADNYFFLRFYHKGEFQKNKYSRGSCFTIAEAVDPDKFSYTVIMEYVKDDLGYNEIGGVYVKKQGGGWKLIDTDADAIRLGQGMSNGSYLDLYVDTVIDKSIEPLRQTQPHVIVRPRTSFFEGN